MKDSPQLGLPKAAVKKYEVNDRFVWVDTDVAVMAAKGSSLFERLRLGGVPQRRAE